MYSNDYDQHPQQGQCRYGKGKGKGTKNKSKCGGVGGKGKGTTAHRRDLVQAKGKGPTKIGSAKIGTTMVTSPLSLMMATGPIAPLMTWPAALTRAPVVTGDTGVNRIYVLPVTAHSPFQGEHCDKESIVTRGALC